MSLPAGLPSTVPGADRGAAHELERPLCEICGLDRAERLVVRKGYRVVRCRGCGLVYVSPRPIGQDPITALYTETGYCDAQIRCACSPARMRQSAERLAVVEQHAGGRRGRLLDVGCSAGSFLLQARARGWECAGIDVSAGAVAHAASVHGLDARVGTLETLGWPAGSFDVITLFECIEHMRHPGSALRAAHRLLAEGGLLVLTTPNVGGLLPRVTYRLLGRTIGAWEHPTPPHHLYQFSSDTLDALLRKTGFETLSCRTGMMGLRYTVDQLTEALLDALKARLARETAARAAGGQVEAAAPPARVPGRPAPTLLRRALRRAVRMFSWTVCLPLYAVPSTRLNVGDWMIVVARRRS